MLNFMCLINPRPGCPPKASNGMQEDNSLFSSFLTLTTMAGYICPGCHD